jgi:hypothetical protein
VLAFFASNVSLPPFIPFIIAASLFLGSPFVHGDSNIFSQELNFDLVKIICCSTLSEVLFWQLQPLQF